jgi:hypothetical protein
MRQHIYGMITEESRLLWSSTITVIHVTQAHTPRGHSSPGGHSPGGETNMIMRQRIYGINTDESPQRLRLHTLPKRIHPGGARLLEVIRLAQRLRRDYGQRITVRLRMSHAYCCHQRLRLYSSPGGHSPGTTTCGYGSQDRQRPVTTDKKR